MPEEKKEVKNEEAPSASPENKEEEEKKEKETPESQPPQDPVKKELENIDKGRNTFTKRERLAFEKKKIEEQEKVLDDEEGITPPVTDETPVTVGMLDKRDREQSKNTALGLAEAIEDEDERNLTIHYLKNRIVPSGNAEADVKFARFAVNSLRNSQIAVESDRKKNPNQHQSAPGAPSSHEKAFQPTDSERIFMQPPYNLTKDSPTTIYINYIMRRNSIQLIK